ncbi:hypothetical protein FO519_001844 [Halicephalobus sp. NKZ332]|nr:hypothetical protein FO519_001844 [Halicephalobus sp. NKZ332]
MAILELLSHVQEYINDDNHFTARWLKKGKTHFGLEADLESIAQVLAGVLAVLLFHGDQAQFITNSICILFPVMVTYIYPREGPPINLLLTYWATFSITSLLDNTFYTILPGYYLLKLFAMACMFLRPINGAQWIFIFLKKNNMSGFRLIRDESEVLKKILPPENPEDNERTVKLQMSFISVKSTSSKEKRSQMENSTSKSPSIDVDRTFPSGPISKQSKKEFDSVTKPLKETSDIFKSATSSGSIEDLSRTLSAYFNFPENRWAL